MPKIDAGRGAAGGTERPDFAQVVVLGAGRPLYGTTPAGLRVAPDHRRILDWIADAFAGLQAELRFVGGYQVADVVRHYPHWEFSVNADWQRSGPVGSLLAAPLPADRTHYVVYGDTVVRRGAVEQLSISEGDVVLAVDTGWRSRYERRPQEDLDRAEKVVLDGERIVAIGRDIPAADARAEFAGLVRLSSDAVAAVVDLRRQEGAASWTMPELVSHLQQLGHAVAVVDIGGDWAELNAPQDLARFVLGTKGQTLERLTPLVEHSVIGDVQRVELEAWRANPSGITDEIARRFHRGRLAIRSSSAQEDGWSASNAGVFRSVLGVDGGDRQAVGRAIEEVAASYGRLGEQEVLVQAMIADVVCSGVAMTRTLSHGAPYYVVVYDDLSPNTDSVTSGTARNATTLIIHRSWSRLPDGCDKRLEALLPAMRELEDLVGHDALDIEFAVTAHGVVHTLQIRPIAVDHGRWTGRDDDVSAALELAAANFAARQRRSPFVAGRRTVLGAMSDWNPAEMIGIRPGRLALSLYRHLITDEVWAQQRAEYGYRDVAPQPLLWTLAGHPYIDVGASLSSFLPADLDRESGDQLIDFQLGLLESNRALHDKVEFDVSLTCAAPGIDGRLQRLAEAGCAPETLSRLRSSLVKITTDGMRRPPGDLAMLDRLVARVEALEAVESAPLDRAFMLLADCRRFGTLPFAHLARSAFVAMAILRGLVEEEALSQSDVGVFMNSLSTVTRQLTEDGRAVHDRTLEWSEYVRRYGHLRPGTYDITAPTYGRDPERFLRPLVMARAPVAEAPSPLADDAVRERVRKALQATGLPADVDGLDTFLRSAIEGRERAKFIFSRSVSRALDAISEFGMLVGLGDEQLADISLQELDDARKGDLFDTAAQLADRAEAGREWRTISACIELPELIVREDDLWAFLRADGSPNFVGDGTVTAPVVYLGPEARAPDVRGCIVVVMQADPGYDWLFGHGPAGLVTAYGGANSHMAIRAAEFGIPAAIGVGAALCERVQQAAMVHLDCENRRVEVVR